MEFLPLEKYSVHKKRRKTPKGAKRNVQNSFNKKYKKAKNVEVKNVCSSESDYVDVEKASAEENLQSEISQQVKEVSEKKKNEKPQIPKLFVNMKKAILNEEQVKEIHPDIISVRFPRKKRSRWCWAVFGSEKKAEKALAKLKTRSDIIVAKAKEKSVDNPKKKTKSCNSKVKKTIRTKIRDAWM